MKLNRFLHKDPIIEKVLWLTIIAGLGFVLNNFINSYLLRQSNELTAETKNLLAKKELGISLHSKITEVKSGFLEMIINNDKRAVYFINKKIDDNLSDVEKILQVLSNGGYYSQTLPVNFYNSNYISDTIFYEPSKKLAYNIEIIDISPKIIELSRLSRLLAQYKIKLFTDSVFTVQYETQIKGLYKEAETYLQRASENSNRIFYDTQQEYQTIRKKREEHIANINSFLILWLVGISAITLIFLFFIIRRIIQMVDSRNEVREELLKKQWAIEKILDAIPVGFIIFDSNYKVIRVNKEAVHLFGASHENNLLDQTCKQLFINQDENICPFKTKNENIIHNELSINTFLGQSRDVIKNATIIEIDGKKAVLETFIDITKRKEIENQLIHAKEAAIMATQEKSKFLASMSHEIRTPLNGIIGMLSLLQKTTLSEKQKDFLDVIQVSSSNLASIINDILDFSKIEAGQIQLDYHNFNFIQEIINNLKVLEMKAEEKGIQLISEIGKNVPRFIIADSMRIKQVFINLVSNAIKFTDEGSVKVTLLYFDESQRIKIEVKDTGIGISKDRLVTIFGAFAQSDSSITRNYGGTGLGLTISKELVELMGGKIGVSSELLRGSLFWFELPVKKGIIPSQTTNDPITMEMPEKNIKILVAEDNLINQKVANAMFHKIGFKIEMANNGQEAVELFEKNLYDMIFMDLQMPVMDGISATVKILQIAKSMNQPVFITAMTANAMKEDKQKCQDIGMQHFLSKPYNAENILEALNKYQLSKQA